MFTFFHKSTSVYILKKDIIYSTSHSCYYLLSGSGAGPELDRTSDMKEHSKQSPLIAGLTATRERQSTNHTHLFLSSQFILLHKSQRMAEKGSVQFIYCCDFGHLGIKFTFYTMGRSYYFFSSFFQFSVMFLVLVLLKFQCHLSLPFIKLSVV